MEIIAHSYLDKNGLFLNGQLLIDLSNEEMWEKKAYQSLNIDYPKFYKMDELSKLAFIATEVLIPFLPKNAAVENDLQLIFANKNASLHTDNRFVETYLDKEAPSPSIFVYTLPNILTGELCIRHKWYGENCFFIDDEFSADVFEKRLQIGFQNQNKWILGGWVDVKSNDEQECFLFLVSNSTNNNLTDELLTTFKRYSNE